MPWKASDASRFTKKAKTPKQKRQHAAVANAVLKRTGSEGTAIRIANSVTKRSARKAARAGRKVARAGRRAARRR